MPKESRGSINPVIAITIVLVLAVSAGLYIWLQQAAPSDDTITFVNRAHKSVRQSSTPTNVPADGSTSLDSARDKSLTTGWKTYRNDKYGFEVRYPADFNLNLAEGQGAIGIVSPKQNYIYLQIQVFNYAPIPTLQYAPNNAQFVKYVTLAGKQAAKYYTKTAIGEIYQENIGKPFTSYVIITGTNQFFELSYFSNNDTAQVFENILSTFKFTK